MGREVERRRTRASQGGEKCCQEFDATLDRRRAIQGRRRGSRVRREEVAKEEDAPPPPDFTTPAPRTMKSTMQRVLHGHDVRRLRIAMAAS